MKRPATKTLVVGHPVVALPLTLASGICLIAGFRAGEVLPVLTAIALIGAVQHASAQASAYREWKAAWEAMDDAPATRRVTLVRVIGGLTIAALLLIGFGDPYRIAFGAAYAVGFAAGWIIVHPWLLVVIGSLSARPLIRVIRRRLTRVDTGTVVAVTARSTLPVPSMADAYELLPPYCQVLLRGHA